MKFTAYIVLLFFVSPFFSQEQSSTNTFHFLLMAGLSPSQVHGDAYNGFHKVGGIGGIGTEVDLNKKTTLSVSFLFIQKGARRNPNPSKGDYAAYFLNLNYIECPLLLTYTHKKYLFDVGASVGYLMNYYEATENGNMTGMYPFQKMEYSVKVGLGYKFTDNVYAMVRSSNSFITTRPNYIKQSIYFNNILAQTFNKGYYNNVLEFTINYRIKLKQAH